MMSRLAMAVGLFAVVQSSWAKPAPAVRDALEIGQSDRTAAIASLEGAAASAKGAARAELVLHAGEQSRLADDFERARAWFLDVLDDPKGRKYAEAARLGLALLDASRGDMSKPSRNALLTISPKDALDTQNAERFAILAVEAGTAGRTTERDLQASRALDFAQGDRALSADIRTRLDAVGARDDLPPPPQNTPVTADKPPKSNDPKPPRVPEPEPDPEPVAVDAATLLTAAREALAEGDRARAKELADKVLGASPDDDQRSGAEIVLRTADAVATSRKVGVLLPTSGKYASVGSQLREAIEDGWSQVSSSHELLFVDSGATPASAVAALDDLVMKEGVVAVLGPLLTVESDAVAKHAEELAVPLASMSQALEDAGSYDWVFQAWLTPEQQVDALLDHAMTRSGMASFAIFAPDNDFGRHAAELFRDGVAERSGEIKVEIFYEAKGNDMSGAARKLGRTGVEGKPLVDFDAIFLPDKGRRVPLAAAGLAYEEFPVGTFDPAGRGSIPLLGLSSWNDASLVASGGTYTRNALFTDVYVPPPSGGGLEWYPTQAWRDFTERLRDKTGRTPAPLEALASDAARVVALAAASNPTSRLAFRRALLDVSPTTSVTGIVGFDEESHEVRRALRVLSVQRNGFVPVDE
jgi:branched-chain amino acid transport system substrate-binding protein